MFKFFKLNLSFLLTATSYLFSYLCLIIIAPLALLYGICNVIIDALLFLVYKYDNFVIESNVKIARRK